MSDIGYVMAVSVFILLGTSLFFYKNITKSLGEFMCLFSAHCSTALVLLVFSFFTTSLKMPADFTVAVLLVMSLFGVTGSYLLFRALARGKASIVALGFASFVLWSSIISWILFDVASGVLNYIAIPILIAGLLLAMLKMPKYGKKKFDYEGVESFFNGEAVEDSALLAVVAGCFVAMYRLAFFFTSKDIGVHRTLVYSSVIMLVFLLFPLLSRHFKELFPRPKGDDWKYLGAGIAAIVFSSIMLFFGLGHLRIDSFLSVVVCFPLVTLILASILLKERYKLWQYLGFLLTIAGCVMILL